MTTVVARLRVPEYIGGLLLLTLNSVDDIEEAINARCNWRVMSAQFLLAVDDRPIDELVEIFPANTGRDI